MLDRIGEIVDAVLRWFHETEPRTWLGHYLVTTAPALVVFWLVEGPLGLGLEMAIALSFGVLGYVVSLYRNREFGERGDYRTGSKLQAVLDFVAVVLGVATVFLVTGIAAAPW